MYLRAPVVAADPLLPERLKGQGVQNEDQQSNLPFRRRLEQALGADGGAGVWMDGSMIREAG